MLIVETGEGLTNSNTYASEAEFDAYCTLRNLTVPLAADPVAKCGALVRSTDYLDRAYKYKSVRLSDDQALECPRLGDEEISTKLKAACIELAIIALTTDLAAPPARGILAKEITAGPVTTKTTYDPASTPRADPYPQITKLVRPVALRVGGSVQVGMMTR